MERATIMRIHYYVNYNPAALQPGYGYMGFEMVLQAALNEEPETIAIGSMNDALTDIFGKDYFDSVMFVQFMGQCRIIDIIDSMCASNR